MKKRITGIGILGVLALAAATTVYATGANENAVTLTVTGQNYCVACTLRKQGASGTCSSKGCQHALKVEVVKDADGNAVDGMKDWTLHYLNNDAAANYLKGHHYETVTVTGTVFLQERVIDLTDS